MHLVNSTDALAAAAPLFADAACGLQVPSILEGTSRGTLLVDHVARPSAGLIWDGLASLYLAGAPDIAAFNLGWSTWVKGTVVPMARELGIPALDVHANPEAWYHRLPDLLAPLPVELLRRMTFTFQRPRIWKPTVPQGYHLEAITPSLLAQDDLAGLSWLQGWILSFWHTLDAFADRGIGFCIIHEKSAIVSLCISVFVYGRAVELGTGTWEAHQRRGLSTASVAACVHACEDRALTPVWQCDAANLSSLTVARKVGFEPAEEIVIRRIPLQEKGLP